MSVLVLLGTWACSPNSGTSTGNPTTVGIKFAGLPEGISPALGLSVTGGVLLTEARIVLRNMDMDPLSACLAEAANPDLNIESGFSFPGPFVVDLLANTSIPDVDRIPVPADDYCEIGVDFDPLRREEVPPGILPDDSIIGHALIVRGSRSDGVPFAVRLDQNDRFKLEAASPDGFAIQGSPAVTLLFFSFDLNAWFAGVDLDGATVSPDGSIVIDDDDNPDLRSIIVENVKRSARLFEDLNGNGILDADEIANSLVLGIGADEPD
ncbi:MAG TPA: hypothetical protein VLJ37_12175 [bacterium]|nr:hypothetical protein [bacterium]